MANEPVTTGPGDTKSLHEQGWKGQGYEWENVTNPQKQRLSLAALKSLGPPGSVRLLDYGCGDGVMTEFFSSQGFIAEGADISELVIDHNRQRFPHLKFELVAPGSPAPYPDGSFDAIFCSEVVEHLYDTHAVFGEFSRLLRPGGLLLLTTPYHGLIKNVLIGLFFFDKHFNPTWQHIRFFNKKSLARICLDHDLSPVSWKTVGRIGPLARSFFLTCTRTATT